MLSMSTFVLLATLAAEPSGVKLEPGATRAANLLDGVTLDSSYRPSASPPLRMTDELRFGLEMPPPSLDDGGGISSDGRQILALILGFIPGFGIGHLIARDRDGFIIFLIVDIVLYAVWGVGWGIWLYPFGYLGGLVWLLVHIYQGYDAYVEAGGARVVEHNRKRSIQVATAPGRDENLSTRIFGFAF